VRDPKPRTLIVTSLLEEVLSGLGKDAVVNEIRHFELFTDGRKAAIALRRPDLVIERTRPIRELATAVQGSGAELLLGRRFVSIEQAGAAPAIHVERSQGAVAEEARVGIFFGGSSIATKMTSISSPPAFAPRRCFRRKTALGLAGVCGSVKASGRPNLFMKPAAARAANVGESAMTGARLIPRDVGATQGARRYGFGRSSPVSNHSMVLSNSQAILSKISAPISPLPRSMFDKYACVMPARVANSA
jgi:hypothetical protein